MGRWIAACTWMLALGGVAYASDSPSGWPTPPAVVTQGLPATAVVRPPGQGDKPHPVEVHLVTDPAVATPGSTVSLGVHLAQDEGWHTYWVSPGEVGQPTDVTWTLPPGAVLAPRVWPVPERFEQDGIASFGYSEQVLHTFDVTLPADMKPGDYPISADVSWLVCQTSCIPGHATVSSVLKVGAAAKPGPNHAAFEAWRARQPVTPEQGNLKVDVVSCLSPEVPNGPVKAVVSVHATEGHTLTREGDAMWPSFAPVASYGWMVDKSKLVADETGFAVPLEGTAFEPDAAHGPDAIGGLVQVKVDGAWVRAAVSQPIAWGAAGAARTPSTDAACKLLEAAAAPADAAPATTAPAVEIPAVAPPAPASLLWNLLMAFIGGLILNVMPCVLPVLTLKLYGLVEQADTSDADKRRAGIMYTLGILASFWALAAAVWGARTMLGATVGWGFQFQYPGYVAALATLVFLFGLSLFGVFEIPTIGGDSAHELGSREGPAGYFFTGVFATLVATPCSAPFLGTATAFAFQAPTIELVAIFTAVGLGLASPFVLVAFVPAAYKLLPRPGAWMEGFKQLLGFTLMGTTLWLVSVLVGQIGSDRAVNFLAFLTATAVGAWVFGRWGGVAGTFRDQLIAGAIGVAIMGAGGWRFVDLRMAEPDRVCDDEAIPTTLNWDEGIPWQAFSPARVESLKGRTLFLDFTADWCVSCKVNEHTVLESDAVRSAMQKLDVVPLEADWTRQDPQISEWLTKYKRAGVPMYLVVPPSGIEGAILLPEVITPTMVTDALSKASGG